jgi:putative redox protein
MVQIDIQYEGGLRCKAEHGPSSVTLVTDAPVDNCGRGESFSPTDLLATGLGTCMLTIMGIVADRTGIDLSGIRINVTKDMQSEPVRRIRRLAVNIHFPRVVSPADRQRLEAAANNCPVLKSLHPDIEIPVQFIYPHNEEAKQS